MLLTRVFLVVLMVMTFAQPLKIRNDDPVPLCEVLVIDTSYSLLEQCDGVECLDMMKMAVLDYARISNESRQFEGFLNAGRNGRHRRFYGYDDLKSKLNELWVTRKHENFQLSDFCRGHNVIFSDFQNDALDQINSHLNDSIGLTLIPIHKKFTRRVYVDSVYIKESYVALDRSLLFIDIINEEQTDGDVLVKLFNGNRQLGSVNVDFNSLGTVTVNFEFEASDASEYHIEIEDSGPYMDSNYYFHFTKKRRAVISVVDAAQSKHIKTLYDSDHFVNHYYSNETMDFDVIYESDLLVMNAVDQIPEWFDIDRFEGDVVVFPSEDIELDGFVDLLNSKLNKERDTVFSKIESQGFENPFFMGIFENVMEEVDLPLVKCLYSLSQSSNTLLKSKSDYLVKVEQESSNVYWFNSPLSADYTGLHNHSLFLPLMFRIAENSIAENEPLAYTLTELPIGLQINERVGLIEIRGNGNKYVPEVAFNGDGMILKLPDELYLPGHYYLMEDSDTLKQLALNIDRNELKGDFHGYEELNDIYSDYPNIKIVDTRDGSNLKSDLSVISGSKSFWKYALILTLMFIIAEVAIHNRK